VAAAAGRDCAGRDLDKARARVYGGIGRIGWKGMHFRKTLACEDEHDWKARKRRSRLDGCRNPDLEIMKPAAQVCRKLGLSVDVRVLSAHRTPSKLRPMCAEDGQAGTKVFISARAARPIWPVLWLPTPPTQ